MKQVYQVIGLMSGSSLDGVDLAYCELKEVNGQWQYKILYGETHAYSDMWRVRLSQLPKQSIEIFPKTHAFYGRYLGQLVQAFVNKHQLNPDFVASHGHTIFHQPEAGFTAQIGDGAAISASCALPVVCDFRSMDLALGGQGAPLVPIGDQLLFSICCLPKFGISNISFFDEGKMHAFDISPCNLVLNHFAEILGQPYDDGGRIAASGSVDSNLLNQLNALDYYTQTGAKSLGREWVIQKCMPILEHFENLTEPDKLATFTHHIAHQISYVLNTHALKNVLVTGGGAFNDFLMQKIREITTTQIAIPEPELVQFKEALIFAFLGVLRVRNQINVLSSVTGAKLNHVGGALYGNFDSLL